jgi:hypothetical protein
MPYTANKKPSGLDAASSVAGTDVLVIEKSGSVQRATATQLVDHAFSTKGTTITAPSGSEVLVARDGATLKDIAISNIVPALNITDAKVAAAAAIAGTKISPNFGSQTVQTTGQVSAGSLAVTGNSTMGGTLVVTGALTANGGISATITGTASSANQLTTARNIAATGDIAWNVNFNGSANVTAAATISNNVVTDAKLRTGGACSVVGRSANSTGNVADISASANDRVLLRTADALSFGQVAAGMIATDAVTTVKIQNDAVTADKLADDASTDGNRAVTTNHIRDLAVTTGKIASLAVDNSKIANTTIELGKLVAAVQQALVPAGAVMPFGRTTAPSGWLIANGDVVPNGSGTVQSITTDFSALYAAVSTNFGTAGQLPDLRGYFVRGSGTNGDGTAAGTFGAKQADALKAHQHFAFKTGSSTTALSATNYPATQGQITPENFKYTIAGNADASDLGLTSSTGDTETRPKNIALLYCIKF